MVPFRVPRLLIPSIAAFSVCTAPLLVSTFAQNPAQAEGTIKLVAPNADVRDVLQQYAAWVGKRLIYDNQVQGNINIDIPDVSKEEAIRIVEITLMVNGYHLVPVDSDPNLLKVTGLTRSPRQVAVPVLTDPEPIPDNEQVVMYLVKLKYADPTELSQTLLAAMPASKQEYAPHIVALPRAQSLILTENTAVIRQMMRIIRAADLEPTRVEGEFITLNRASAKDVVTMLEKLFEKPQQGPTPVARPPVAVPGGAAPGAAAPAAAVSPLTTVEIGGMTEDSMLSGKVRLTADERTNRIYVVSRPVNLPIIRRLVEDFDLDVPFDEPYVRYLKHVNAGDILEALVRAVSDPGTKDSQLLGTGGAGGTRTTGTTQAQAPASQFGNQFGGAGRSAGGLQGTTPTMSLQSELRETIPQTVLVGNARIVADKRGNAIIVIGSKDIKDKVDNLLQRLDVRTPQVMLTTIIGELSLGDGQQLGLTYLMGNGRKGTNLSNFVSGGTAALGSAVGIKDNAISLDFKNLLSNTTLRQIVGGGVGGVQGFVMAGDTFGSLVTALESTNKFRVTSRPTIFASNNKKSSLLSGERIAVITGVQSGIGGGVANNLVQQNQVSYIDVNLNLEVVPLINSDKEVHLDIVQTLMERTGETVIDNNKYPVISNRQLQTSVTVPNEGTLVLGGLIKQARSKTVSGVPVLSRAPLIGPLFRSTSTENKRSELVILIRPSVAVGNEDVLDVRDRNMKPMQIPVNLEDGLGLGAPLNRSNAPDAPYVRFRSEPPALAPGEQSPGTPPPSRSEDGAQKEAPAKRSRPAATPTSKASSPGSPR